MAAATALDQAGTSPRSGGGGGTSDGKSKETPTVCLIGPTGSGKSSTGNSCFGCRGVGGVFEVDERSMSSVTSKTVMVERSWRGKGARIRVVDSPGLGDSEGRDPEHIESLAIALKDEVKYVHAFLVVFNSQEPRLSRHVKEMLTVFKDMFGDLFLRYTMIVFTRWEHDKRAKKKRARSGATEEQRAKLINEELQKLLGHDFECPCVFIDNAANATAEVLEDLYENEAQDVRKEFEDELDKIHEFMFRSQTPFLCQDVKAVVLEKEVLRRKIMQLMQLVNEDALGRQVISAETGVIHKGWLRWKRRWIWGILRRQHLRLFTDEGCVEPTGPREVDLTGCICSTGIEWQLIPRRFPAFTVYRPVNVQGAARSYFCHVFQVKSLEDRRCWVLLMQEATQISESCHRIQKFHDSLRVAPSRTEYERAVAIVLRETMVIPVEWVFQQGCHLVASSGRKPSLQQAIKDLQRDRVRVDGVDFVCPSGDDLGAHLCHRILDGAGWPQDEHAEVKAAVLARDVLLGCSRTQGGGDTFDAVQVLFGGNENLEVHCKPEATTEPILVRVLCRKTSETDVLCSIGTDTGVPQFQRDASAKALSSELVRAMDLNGEQKLCSTLLDTDFWVPDHQMVQCMRCGERFNPFLRRHHCRACGALVCYSCSRHSVPVSSANAPMSIEDLHEALDASQVRCERVCFSCYQRAVIRDLNARKERGQQAVVNEDELLSLKARSTSVADLPDSVGVHAATAAAGPGQPNLAECDALPARSFDSFVSEDAEDVVDVAEASVADEQGSSDYMEEADPWPAISVEMASTYKIVATGPSKLEEWYVLECKYVRVIRWNGLADEGRIFISVKKHALNGDAEDARR